MGLSPDTLSAQELLSEGESSKQDRSRSLKSRPSSSGSSPVSPASPSTQPRRSHSGRGARDKQNLLATQEDDAQSDSHSIAASSRTGSRQGVLASTAGLRKKKTTTAGSKRKDGSSKRLLVSRGHALEAGDTLDDESEHPSQPSSTKRSTRDVDSATPTNSFMQQSCSRQQHEKSLDVNRFSGYSFVDKASPASMMPQKQQTLPVMIRRSDDVVRSYGHIFRLLRDPRVVASAAARRPQQTQKKFVHVTVPSMPPIELSACSWRSTESEDSLPDIRLPSSASREPVKAGDRWYAKSSPNLVGGGNSVVSTTADTWGPQPSSSWDETLSSSVDIFGDPSTRAGTIRGGVSLPPVKAAAPLPRPRHTTKLSKSTSEPRILMPQRART